VVESTTDETVRPDAEQKDATKGVQAEDDFVLQLAALFKQLKFSKNLKKAMKEVEVTILDLMRCKMFTIFQSFGNGKEILASFKGDIRPKDPNEKEVEIRVPFTPTSLAGYVALSQRPILVEDVYDADKLTEIHARLKWDKSFSESQDLFFKSMIVVPIKDDILLGVVQLIRFKDDPVFTSTDLKHAQMLAQMLAKQFRSEFQSTQGPYDYLVQQGKLSAKDLDEIEKGVSLYGGTVTKMLMDDYKLEPQEIGKSLELYYRVPYMKFDPNITLPVDLMENLGASYLRNNLWVPVAGSKEEVTILISDPSNYRASWKSRASSMPGTMCSGSAWPRTFCVTSGAPRKRTILKALMMYSRAWRRKAASNWTIRKMTVTMPKVPLLPRASSSWSTASLSNPTNWVARISISNRARKNHPGLCACAWMACAAKFSRFRQNTPAP